MDLFGALLCMTLLLPGVARSQPVVQEITANPEAKPLRQIWTVYGNDTLGGARVGLGIGGVGDVNSDGLMDFAVNWGAAGEWRIFYGSRDSISHTPAQVFKHYGTVPYHPVVGDFWGTGHKAVGFPAGSWESIDDHLYFYYRLDLFRTDSNRIDTAVALSMNFRTTTPAYRDSPTEILGADLDGDGADELIVFWAGTHTKDTIDRHPEIWIYRGGPDFQLDTPTVVIRDTEVNGGSGRQALFIGHWDSDQYMDLATSSDYADGAQKLKFYFGRPGSPWNWTTAEEVIPFGGLVALDCDGDGVLDIAAPESGNVMDLFLSRGKNIRDRDLTLSDVDRRLSNPGYHVPVRLGSLNDSSYRYEMLGIIGPEGLLGFSGSESGPDDLFDTYYNGEDPLYVYMTPVGDVTGDGYDDFLTGNFDYGLQSGIAALFAGGPYIPHDWQTSAVDQIAVTGESDRISIWPNPLGDELHITWSTDRLHAPGRFVVHDVLGSEIARGTIDPFGGHARWRCADLPAGTYLLTIFDNAGRPIATTRLMKQ
jgi:hypothetical protein